MNELPSLGTEVRLGRYVQESLGLYGVIISLTHDKVLNYDISADSCKG